MINDPSIRPVVQHVEKRCILVTPAAAPDAQVSSACEDGRTD
jgi:hypothetical protein